MSPQVEDIHDLFLSPFGETTSVQLINTSVLPYQYIVLTKFALWKTEYSL